MKQHTIKKISFLLPLLLLSGCACVDPLEPVNRKIFAFNMALDKAVFRPVARAYQRAVPAPVVCHVNNFFNNIDDLTSMANNVLQFKFCEAGADFWRFVLNTTFGFLGFSDVATPLGIPRYCNDFGLTLARYGFVRSSYLMLPFFGPSTFRDTIGWSVDWRYLSVWGYLKPTPLRYSIYGVRLIHKRAELLCADQLIDDAVDPYLFVRDAYMQKRDCDIKHLWPDCEQTNNAEKTAVTGDKSSDPFVPAEGNQKDADDPFVSDDGKDNSSDKPKAKPSTTASANGDPFVAP